MSSENTVWDSIRGDDHWVSLLVGGAVMVLLGVLLNVQWFWLLLIGALVSGVVEMAITEVPPDPERYDEDQYVLWDAAFGDGTTTEDELRAKLRARENDEPVQPTDEDRQDGLDRLRDRYARGDLTEEQFERKLEHLLETDTPENAAEWQTREREPIEE